VPGLQLVSNQRRVARIIENRGQALGQAVLFVDFAQQKQSGIGGDVAAGEISFNLAARESGVKVRFSGTLLDSGFWCWFLV